MGSGLLGPNHSVLLSASLQRNTLGPPQVFTADDDTESYDSDNTGAVRGAVFSRASNLQSPEAGEQVQGHVEHLHAADGSNPSIFVQGGLLHLMHGHWIFHDAVNHVRLESFYQLLTFNNLLQI